MSIANWPASERPREKLLTQGATALSDAELLAIFLRTGCAGKSAVDLARELLSSFNGLRPLMEATQAEFCKEMGLGPAKFAQLQAVLEMARRHLSATLERGDVLTTPELVKQFLKSKLRHQQQEVFAILFLDNQNRLLHYQALFYGTLDGASVYPREVVKKALSYNAAAVILSHNHPSGVAEPSQADLRITKRLQQALELVGVRILDHMIVVDAEVVSFAESGLL